MKFVIATDSFKGSMTSVEAAEAAKAGILRAQPDAQVEISYLADGGEGTIDALKLAYGATECQVQTLDPLEREITVKYYVAGKIAIMEASSCVGLTLLSEDELNPMHTTTYGLGLMIKDAIARGCRDFIIGIGGSATNDGGAGMLQALGFLLLDSEKNEIKRGAFGAGSISTINRKKALPALKECTFKILCDVTNPLLGKNGATYVYSPQKGAKGEMLPIMETSMERFCMAIKKRYPNADPTIAGCGAAGGLGFAFFACLKATLVRGIDMIIEATRLEEKIIDADVVITGEGKLDRQTLNGKAPMGVVKLAKKHGKRIIVLCGATGSGYEKCQAEGMDEIYVIADPKRSTYMNIKTKIALQNMENTTYNLFKTR